MVDFSKNCSAPFRSVLRDIEAVVEKRAELPPYDIGGLSSLLPLLNKCLRKICQFARDGFLLPCEVDLLESMVQIQLDCVTHCLRKAVLNICDA